MQSAGIMAMPVGDHFYTMSTAEREGAFARFGYVDEGTAAFVFDYQAPSTTPLYRLLNGSNGDHFYTTSPVERDGAIANFGYTFEQIACYVFDTQITGTVPLFRLLNGSNGDHFYTTSPVERDGAIANFGYTFEQIACYVFDTQITGTVPLFRLLKVADLASAVRLHFKTLTQPNVPPETMISSMRQVYTTAGLRVDVVPFASYSFEQTSCFVYSTQATGTVPLFRLLNGSNGDHFYTTSPVERDGAIANFGYTFEQIACYVFDTQITGTVPLFRLLNGSNGDHFYTTSPVERDGAIANFGYTFEQIACYVFDWQMTSTTPLLRLLNSSNGDHFYTTSELERWNAETVELLNLPLLTVLDVGQCLMGGTTAETLQLFGNRTNANANDVVVYFVQSTAGSAAGVLNGCAAHPANQPGCVVTQIASRWTLAHEVGHVLSLNHLPGENCGAPGYVPTRLMTGCGTGRILGTPTLISTEITTMQNSPLATSLVV